MLKFEVVLTAEEEDETPEQSEKRTGSTPGYARAVRNVMRKAEGLWGWCSAKVEVNVLDNYGKVNGSGTAYLGNCSYESAHDFVENSGYFHDMVKEALQEAEKRNIQPRCPRCHGTGKVSLTQKELQKFNSRIKIGEHNVIGS